MIVVPINPNSVYVPMLQTGCCKRGFDSTYPIHLNGIINQNEYQESIDNINRATSSTTSMIVVAILCTLCLVGGMALFIAGGITAVSSRSFGFPILVAIGFGIFALGMFIIAIGCCIIQSRRQARIHEAIAKESMKYTMRSPTPCSWRLDISRISFGGYRRNRNTQLVCQLVIDIGHNVAPGYGNTPYQVAPQPRSFFEQQNNIPRPPSYHNQPTAGFCPQCGTQRQNFTAKFCPSCGQPVNAY